MYIEVRNAGFINKGAELMLHAVIQQVRNRIPSAKLVMAPGGRSDNRPYYKRARLGSYQKASFSVGSIQMGGFVAAVPERLREMYGVVLDRDIDVVLDIAGYSYNDRSGNASLLELAKSSRRWKRRGTKTVLLPQAFGPFSSSKSQNLINEIANNFDLIYVRDEVSYALLTEVTGPLDKIKCAPDFTNLVAGQPPQNLLGGACKICLIPNYRMIDSTPASESAQYMVFMELVLKEILSQGIDPFFLVHEGADDLGICEALCSSVARVPIVVEDDPLKIKGIIGSCDGVIGSRYHGLVSALSQGVPALATGWTHKYQALFEDYNFEAGILSTEMDASDIKKAIALISSENTRKSISSNLVERSDVMCRQVESMWDEVFGLIGS